MNQKALSFLETMVLAIMDKWPPDLEVDEQLVCDKLEKQKLAIAEWMMREPTWMGLVAADISMDENQVRDCYNNPLGFKDFCHDFLYTHFTKVMVELDMDVIDILIKHKFIEKDCDEPDR